MKSFFIKFKIIIIIIIAALAIGGGYWYVKSNQAPSFSDVTAQKGNVVASLDEPGTVLAENDVDLSFQNPGEITTLNAQDGQTVSAGTVLASLDTSSLNATVEQANAAVAAAQAQLDALQAGTRPEQLAINQAAVVNASTSLGVTVGSAYAAADDAVQNQTDNLFTTPDTNNPVFVVPEANSQDVTNIESERLTIGGALAQWYASTIATTTNQTTLANTALSTLQQIASYLNSLALAVNAATPNGTITAATLAGFKANVVVARTEVNNSITALTSAESALSNAEDALTLAQAGATSQQIEAQQALVLQAQAAAQSAQVALQHAELVAPFAGTVENVTAKIGQVVAPGVPVASLINQNGLKVQTYISEADVAKIKAGDMANVTLDAFGTGTVFPATITTIASLETQVNGVSAYEVDLHFTNTNDTIKDGMTGNVHIILGEHDNVVEVPSRLVINDGNNYFVLLQEGNQSVKQQVQVGLTGDDGMTEITSGVSAGDTLTNF